MINPLELPGATERSFEGSSHNPNGVLFRGHPAHGTAVERHGQKSGQKPKCLDPPILRHIADSQYLPHMKATFRLARYVRGRPHWAEVTVEVAPAGQPDVVMGEEVFAWLHVSYGPNATTRGPAYDELKAKAADGARYALRRLPPEAQPVRVLITEIRDSPVDTNEGDVKFAAAHSVWQALGHEPEHRPWITDDSIVVFPE